MVTSLLTKFITTKLNGKVTTGFPILHIGCAFLILCPCTDRRRRSGAQTSGTDVKRSRTGRRSVQVPRRIPRKGEFGLVLPRTFVFCVILSPLTIYKPSQLHIHFLSLVFVLKSMNTFLFPHFSHIFLKVKKLFGCYDSIIS